MWAFIFLYKLVFLWLFFYVHQKYYSHYQWDFWLIFLDASQLYDLLWQSPTEFLQTFFHKPISSEKFYLSEQPRAFFTAKLYLPFVLLTQKNWLLSSLYAVILYLIAFYFFAETLLKLFPKYEILVYGLMFLPSLTFWASGTSKEIWLMVCIWGVFALHLQIFYLGKKSFYRFLLIVFLFFLLLKVKYYYAFGIAFALLTERLIYFWQNEKFTKKLKWAFSLPILISVVLLSFLHPNLHLDFFPQALYENYRLTLQASPQGSAVDLDLEPTWSSCLLNSYKGTWIGIFAPLSWQAKNTTMLMASVENTTLVALMILSVLLFFIYHFTIPQRNLYLAVASFLFVLLMATFLGLSSPNFGALSRYRIGFSWILWLWIGMIWEKWLKTKIKTLRKN
ncbi:hypothetical protein [Raineya orbicola]|uniref:hypothetical protein n=1 Tax=Raineya orbicola TaxID=2016530 RepID=UPI00105621E7|nr:hypothetical protein [Raineya orbicola]